MFDDCECGENCDICEECGFPECECKCNKDPDEELSYKEWDDETEW
ncbi:hypothetical protein JW752_01090 [Candidatus Peregrinibacteria bacterium]|nr:hypothetical protein [Candidatus Peregrinibacteria bacterium]